MDKVGIGIIGCGNISERYLANLNNSALVQLNAVADLNHERAKQTAAANGLRSASTAELLDDPSIDIIINLTVPAVHAQVSSAILGAGKHAYSEKPLACSFAEATSLLAEAKELKLRVGCAPDTFLGGAHQNLRRLVDCGDTGAITGGAVAFLSPGMEARHPDPEFFFKAGGGPVLDMGPYYVALLVNLIGPVESVTAVGTRAQSQRTITSEKRHGQIVDVEVDTTVNAILRFKSGANITLTTSWDVINHKRSPVELYGTQATVIGADPNWFGGDLHLATNSRDWHTTSSTDWAFTEPNRQLRPGLAVADYRGIGVLDMALAILHERPHRASAELALHTLEVLEGIAQSAEVDSTTWINTVCERPAPLGHGSPADESFWEPAPVALTTTDIPVKLATIRPPVA